MPDPQQLREEVRAFVKREADEGRIRIGEQAWTTWDRDFSIRCAKAGYIGMTWPKAYGGHERTPSERYVVCEELLAAGAPLGAHWIADRQSGPQILQHGREALKREVLPRIAAGECTLCIGMSEPDSGSDLSSIRTRAERVEGGWRLTGRKIWTTNAHKSEYMIALCRTAPRSEDRYEGMSQLVVDMRADGVDIRPITNIADIDEFNEVVFDGAYVPDSHVLGQPGDGWKLVTGELAFERSGPDRILSSFGLLRLLTEAVGRDCDRHTAIEIGRLTARLAAIRTLSIEVSRDIEAGRPTGAKATMMKELGTTLEQEIPEVARRLCDRLPRLGGTIYERALAVALLNAPSYSLRGGTREILHGIIARELGLR